MFDYYNQGMTAYNNAINTMRDTMKKPGYGRYILPCVHDYGCLVPCLLHVGCVGVRRLPGTEYHSHPGHGDLHGCCRVVPSLPR